MNKDPATKSPTDKERDAARRRGTGPTRLAVELPGLTRTAFRNSAGGRGFAEAGLVTEWPAIVGPEVARMSRPVQLAFPRGERKGGVITIQCGGAAALELQHLKPQILERINSHFGYGAVAELRFRQGDARMPQRHAKTRRDSKPASPAEIASETSEITARLTSLPDGEVKDSLLRFGLAMRRRSATK